MYEDEGDNYNYEKGAHAEIPMTWDDATRTLTIQAREGSYEGMPQRHTFMVSVVGGKTKKVAYKGKAVSVRL